MSAATGWKDKGMTLSPTDMIAGIALLVSAVTAFITWKNHQDSGGRVTVKMNASAYVPFAGVGKLARNTSGKFNLKETSEPCVELAQIVIENPGRTGVTITGVSLRIEGIATQDYTVTPRLFTLADFGAETASRDTFFRLEPYDRRTLLFDYWSVVDAQFKQDPSLHELTIHAEVSVAGHDLPFDSKKHGYWRIRRDFVSVFNGHTLRRPRNILLTELLRRNYSDLADINDLDQLVVTIEDTSDIAWSHEQLQKHIEEVLAMPGDAIMFPPDEPLMHHIAAYEATQQYKRLGAQVRPFPVAAVRTDYYKRRGLTPREEPASGD